jgi:DHA1 family bicyclomycin/chloramphenicol resistance-like MFS transporter
MLLSKKQQTTTIFILGALIALSPFSIDMYLPASPVIATSLQTDTVHIG